MCECVFVCLLKIIVGMIVLLFERWIDERNSNNNKKETIEVNILTFLGVQRPKSMIEKKAEEKKNTNLGLFEYIFVCRDD